MVGDSGVGKSQLSQRFCKDTFVQDSKTTVGMEFATKTVAFERCEIKAQIWDTAGQERFESMTKAFYRDAVGAFLIFDVTSSKSLQNLKNIWIPQLKEFGYSGVKRVLIGNKSDAVEGKSSPLTTAAKELAMAEGIDYIETSALTGVGVEIAFRRLVLYVASLLPDVR